ncbi:MAG: class I tRNA ligase family protein, partial [bacterium]|nr:class I tRNA ligase family protein [bacterium]
MTELEKIYRPDKTEEKWYGYWLEKGLFHAQIDETKKPYTIMMPPPNVTGILHMGHALQSTIQDLLIRYHRMRGYSALWMPGTDHAGIATQNVVERKLRNDGTSREEVGRKKFVDEVWEWKEKHGNIISNQQKKLGSSCDWDRERFTMDEGLSKAVKKVFVSLYEKDMIYKGKYIVNWCPHHQTALSDEEAPFKESTGHLWHIKYPLEGNSDKYVVVATTRPETMLGDTAVAVNPTDKRYKNLIGKNAVLPILNRKIKIIADDHIDKKFGTGAVKVTPAHDPNDFMIGNRHDLERIVVIDEKGVMTAEAGELFEGLDRFECRKKLVNELENQGFLEKIEDYEHSIRHCYR